MEGVSGMRSLLASVSMRLLSITVSVLSTYRGSGSWLQVLLMLFAVPYCGSGRPKERLRGMHSLLASLMMHLSSITVFMLCTHK